MADKKLLKEILKFMKYVNQKSLSLNDKYKLRFGLYISYF